MLQRCLYQQFLFLADCFPLNYDFSDFKSGINRHLLTVGSFETFPVCFNHFVILFLVTPYLVVAVQRCMEGIPIKDW